MLIDAGSVMYVEIHEALTALLASRPRGRRSIVAAKLPIIATFELGLSDHFSRLDPVELDSGCW